MKREPNIPTISEKLSAKVNATNYEDIPPETVVIAKRCMLDFIGVAIAGAQEPGITPIRKYIGALREEGAATVIGMGIKRSPRIAAFANGTFGHYLDFDDAVIPAAGGGGPHITAAVLPAALAVAEEEETNGKELLCAYILGCETAYRIGRGVEPKHYNLGWHSTGTVGTFGAAAAAGKLMRLNSEQLSYALGIVASMASGLRENFGTAVKSIHAGQAAANGISAALLASLGCDSARNIFEGKYGFCRLFADDARLNEIMRDEGAFACIPQIRLKLYPCCGASHTAIHAALGIVWGKTIFPEDITRVEIRCDPLLTTILKFSSPRTGLEGKFSMEFPVALALLEKKVSLEQFSDDKVKEKHVIDLMRKIKVIPDATLKAKSGHATTKAEVTIRLRSGEKLTGTCDYRPGAPENPIPDDEVFRKYRGLAARTLKDNEIEESVSMIMEIEKQPTLVALIELLGKGK